MAVPAFSFRTMSSSALLCFALLAAFSLLLTPLRAEEGGQPLALFYPVEEPYLGGFATYGTTKMEEAEAKNAVTFSSEPGKIAGFVRWFAKHVPLPVPTVKGWKGGNVRLQIEEVDGSGPTPVTLAWRGNVDPAELGPVTEANVTIESTTKAVLLPLPMSMASPSRTSPACSSNSPLAGSSSSIASRSSPLRERQSSMSSGLLSRAAVAALVVPSLLALLPAFAEDLVSVREVILPLASATRPGDVVAYGQSTVKKEGDIVVLSASSGEAALARWFPNHLRLKGADFPDSGLRLLVETEGGTASP